MWNSSVPTKGDKMTISGCVFGCIVGNDSYTQFQKEWSEGFGWSGCGLRSVPWFALPLLHQRAAAMHAHTS